MVNYELVNGLNWLIDTLELLLILCSANEYISGQFIAFSVKLRDLQENIMVPSQHTGPHQLLAMDGWDKDSTNALRKTTRNRTMCKLAISTMFGLV